MDIKLKSGKIIKIRKNISLDERDDLLDGIEYNWDSEGNMKGIKMMNKTITKWLRTCLDKDSSDEELIKWSIEDRTDAFLKIQESISLGEGKASK